MVRKPEPPFEEVLGSTRNLGIFVMSGVWNQIKADKSQNHWASSISICI